MSVHTCLKKKTNCFRPNSPESLFLKYYKKCLLWLPQNSCPVCMNTSKHFKNPQIIESCCFPCMCTGFTTTQKQLILLFSTGADIFFVSTVSSTISLQNQDEGWTLSPPQLSTTPLVKVSPSSTLPPTYAPSPLGTLHPPIIPTAPPKPL